jgi:hypothetical protein
MSGQVRALVVLRGLVVTLVCCMAVCTMRGLLRQSQVSVLCLCCAILSLCCCLWY